MSEDLQAWVGRTETRTDVIGVERCVAMQAAVDSPVFGGVKPLVAGDPLPPLWHWLYFWDELVWVGGFAALEMTIGEWRGELLALAEGI